MTTSRLVELQPWTMIFRVSGGFVVEQPREHWLDAQHFQEALLNVEIAYIDLTGGASLQVQTSINDDPRSMLPMKNATGMESSFTAARSGGGAAFLVPADSAAPLGRWVRWIVSGSGPFTGTFRITALLRNAGGG